LQRANSQLEYAWQFIVKHNGRNAIMWYLEVWPKYKTLLWFYKPNDEGKPSIFVNVADLIGNDFIESQHGDKIFHKWEQSIVEADHLIKPLTVEGQIVLDTFMGFGTTGAAALVLNRKFIGIEEDNTYFHDAARRLSKFATKN
jgi:DNA methylase